jgi:hypothetical protein
LLTTAGKLIIVVSDNNRPVSYNGLELFRL